MPSDQAMLTAQSDPVELYQKLCSVSVMFKKALDACVEYRKQLDDANADLIRTQIEMQLEIDKAEAEVERLTHLCEWVETLLCNAESPKHSTEEEWLGIVKNWRDQYHNPDKK